MRCQVHGGARLAPWVPKHQNARTLGERIEELRIANPHDGSFVCSCLFYQIKASPRFSGELR